MAELTRGKIVQIATAQSGQTIVLYVLDDKGRVYSSTADGNRWSRVPLPEELDLDRGGWPAAY
jgi:hypothetical protein